MSDLFARAKELEEQIERLKRLSAEERFDLADVISALEERRQGLFDTLDCWQKAQIARDAGRPKALDYVQGLFEEFTELKGDRLFMDDPALVGGFAWFRGTPVYLLAQEKGKSTEERVRRNFGMASPEGYRKAMRIMDLAEKAGKPLVTLVDTPGAYPGIGAEERGQASAIAECILRMSRLRVPTVAVVIGEGGSGGALALAVGNRVLMLEHAIYSVISPEGCASILYRDPAKAPVAANALKITASDLLRMGIVDGIVKEPLGGAHKDPAAAIRATGDAIASALAELALLSPEACAAERYAKFRAMGRFREPDRAEGHAEAHP